MAILTVQGEGELSGEQAVFETEIVAASVEFVGEIAFLGGESGECGREVKGAGSAESLDVILEQVHERGRQGVHSEEAKVMAGSQTGHNEALLGLGWRGFFEDLVDFVEAGLGGDAFAADCAVEGESAFMGGLDGGDGAVLGTGDGDELLGAAL